MGYNESSDQRGLTTVDTYILKRRKNLHFHIQRKKKEEQTEPKKNIRAKINTIENGKII